MYDLNKINEYLLTESIGRTIIQFDLVTSTFSKAKNIFSTCPEGTVVLSENLERWNLRMGREWICCPGNIYLSIILKPLVNNHSISKYDVLGCASLCDALNEAYNLNCKIKWPNDILIDSNKIASVSSNLTGKNKNPGVIISLGINAHMSKEELEVCEEIKSTATSLMIELSDEVDREILIAEILNNVEKYYIELIKDNKTITAVNAFNQSSMLINKNIEIMKKGNKIKRTVCVRGINQEGNLIINDSSGNEEILSPGETIITYEKNA